MESRSQSESGNAAARQSLYFMQGDKKNGPPTRRFGRQTVNPNDDLVVWPACAHTTCVFWVLIEMTCESFRTTAMKDSDRQETTYAFPTWKGKNVELQQWALGMPAFLGEPIGSHPQENFASQNFTPIFFSLKNLIVLVSEAPSSSKCSECFGILFQEHAYVTISWRYCGTSFINPTGNMPSEEKKSTTFTAYHVSSTWRKRLLYCWHTEYVRIHLFN